VTWRAVRRLVSVAIAVPLVIAAGSAAVAAPAHARVQPAVAARVRCTKRPSIQPPPRGIVKPAPGQTGARPAGGDRVAVRIKPVCPAGEVPVITDSPPGLPKGNPERPGSITGTPAGGRSAGARVPQARRIDQPCAGVMYSTDPGECFYYAGASDSRTAQGGGLTTTIEKPSYDNGGGPGHTLEEISVQGGPREGNIVEIGSSVSTDQFGNADPHLFVYHWLAWAQTCYSCNWHQYSNTYYPNMDLSSFVGHSVYNGYVYYQGNWWAWFNDQWVGWFPGSLWKGQFTNSTQVQWFGEVATQNGEPPLTQMGDGLFPSNPAAAPMSTMCDVDAAAWVCYYYDQQSLYQTAPQYYGVLHTGFGAIRLGGPGT
jgi:hypothetical protein